jgi:hypothetical protein
MDCKRNIPSKIYLGRSDDAFSLAELMIALGISGFLILVANQMLSDINKWMASITVDVELVEIAQKISGRVDCEETFKKLGIDSGSIPSFSTQVQLYDKNGRSLFQNHTLKGTFAAYKRVVDDWLVDSKWMGQGFTIRVGKASKKPNIWAKDPVTKQSLSFSATGHTLFGSSPNIPLCPKPSKSNVLLTRITTTSGTINSLLGKPNPGTIFDVLGRNAPPYTPENRMDLTIMNLTPMTFVRGCHYFCRMPGNNYTSGIMTNQDDAFYVFNPLTNSDEVIFYPVGESRVTCECYL